MKIPLEAGVPFELVGRVEWGEDTDESDQDLSVLLAQESVVIEPFGESTEEEDFVIFTDGSCKVSHGGCSAVVYKTQSTLPTWGGQPRPLFSLSMPLDFQSIIYATEQAGLILAVEAMRMCQEKYGKRPRFHVRTDSQSALLSLDKLVAGIS